MLSITSSEVAINEKKHKKTPAICFAGVFDL